MKLPEQIESERIILKKSVPSFELAKKLYAVADKSRETLREWQPWVDKTNSPEDEYTHYLVEWCQKHWDEGTGFAYLIVLKETEGIIGCVDIYHISKEDKSGELGYWLSNDAVGHGYMQEALKILEKEAFNAGLNRIWLWNDTQNIRSVNVTKRLNYHLDGVMRQDAWDEVHQRFRDTNVWSKLKSEWEKEREC